MSDSSSVDRWHPSNVEWPVESVPTGPITASVGYVYEPGEPHTGAASMSLPVVPATAYEALFADRGRVLAAARELARILGGELYAYDEGDDGWETITAALASFREVDQ